jgi:hypothetical protein
MQLNFCVGVLVTLRLARSSAQRSPDHDIPHTNGNGLHHEGIDLIALSSNIPPASATHLDTKVRLGSFSTKLASLIVTL